MWPPDSILQLEYSIELETVVCRRPGCVEKVRPWGSGASAWRLGSGGAWAPFVPEFRIGELEQTVAIYSRGRVMPCRRRQVAAFRFLLESWPEEVRRRVNAFPGPHWPLLMLANWSEKAALQLIETNPALAWSVAKARDPELLFERRRTIAGSMGFPETESSVRVLGRISAAHLSDHVIEQLREILGMDGREAGVLRRVPRINALVIEGARMGLPRDVLERLGGLEEPVAHFDPATLANVDPHPPVAEPAPRRMQDAFVFPEPPLDAPAGMAPIRTHTELIAEGERMHHCAGSQSEYARRVAAGRLYFYRMVEPERATVCIIRGPRYWGLEQVAGACNAPVQPRTRDLIHAWLFDQAGRRTVRPAQRRGAFRDDRQLRFAFAEA